jgi:signal transduction histidine kinase
MLILSPELIIQGVSDAYLKATLSERKKIIGRYVFDVFPDNPYTPQANSVRNLKASLEQVIQTKKPHQMPIQHYDVPDPKSPGQFAERHWSPLNLPVLDEKGEVTCIIHQVTNVTDQVKTQGLLLQSQTHEQRGWVEADRQRARLHDLLMQAPAAICVLEGPDLVFELVNAGFQAWFPDRELLGKPVRAGLPEIVGQPIDRILRQVYHTGKAFEGKELPIHLVSQAGGTLEESYFNFIYQPRRDEEGRVDGIMVFAYEVTDMVMARKEVEKNARQLTRINQDLDNFVYTASHDLKAPISNIEGLLRALERQMGSETKQKQTVQEIYRLLYASVERFKLTIRDLTEVARISKESQEDVGVVTFGEVLEELLPDLEPQRAQTGARLEVRLGCEPVRFSRKNLKSILYNLLSNALKYRSPDREAFVEVYCHTHESYQVLTVRDNGLGMDMRQEEKIFALFKRLHTHVEGTGIGLYIVKKMVENAGGKIEVESQLNVGSSFKVYFKREEK